MSGKLTWKKPNGEWGVEGVDLTALTPAAYAAIAKLKDIEHPICPSKGDLIRARSDEELAQLPFCPYITMDGKLCTDLHPTSGPGEISEEECNACAKAWYSAPAGS